MGSEITSDLESKLKTYIQNTPELMATAKACVEVGLPNFYIAGGSITQLIWNTLSGESALKGIKDFDIVYFEESGSGSEEVYTKAIKKLIAHGVEIDVVNQATVHEWYPQKFGQRIAAYTHVEQGIDSWLSAFSIGFRLNHIGEITLYSTNGLSDAFNMVVKPNKIAMSKESYVKMTAGYLKRWPEIEVVEWEKVEVNL
jgi:hypothetical protein